MKPDYKNWVPKGLTAGLSAGSVFLLAATLVFTLTPLAGNGALRWILSAAFGISFIICALSALWCIEAYRAFSYGGKRQLSRQIIKSVADYVSVPQGGRILDVGCGSGALTIACAKRNPGCEVVGLNRWGKEYLAYNLQLCENNAKAEGVKNVRFVAGNAIKLPFPDESFDAVTSNYVYHNIAGHNKQALLMETLRVLKKGGTFSIHDLMSQKRYGDMNAFAARLKQQGYERVERIDTANGKLMSAKEAKRLKLSGSAILYGVK